MIDCFERELLFDSIIDILNENPRFKKILNEDLFEIKKVKSGRGETSFLSVDRPFELNGFFVYNLIWSFTFEETNIFIKISANFVNNNLKTSFCVKEYINPTFLISDYPNNKEVDSLVNYIILNLEKFLKKFTCFGGDSFF